MDGKRCRGKKPGNINNKFQLKDSIEKTMNNCCSKHCLDNKSCGEPWSVTFWNNMIHIKYFILTTSGVSGVKKRSVDVSLVSVIRAGWYEVVFREVSYESYIKANMAVKRMSITQKWMLLWWLIKKIYEWVGNFSHAQLYLWY